MSFVTVTFGKKKIAPSIRDATSAEKHGGL